MKILDQLDEAEKAYSAVPHLRHFKEDTASYNLHQLLFNNFRALLDIARAAESWDEHGHHCTIMYDYRGCTCGLEVYQQARAKLEGGE